MPADARDRSAPRAWILCPPRLFGDVEPVASPLHPLNQVPILPRQLMPRLVHICRRGRRYQLHGVLLKTELLHKVRLNRVTVRLQVLRLAEKLPCLVVCRFDLVGPRGGSEIGLKVA